MHAASQRQLLDEYAGLLKDVRALSRLHQAWRDAQEEHRALKQAGDDRANRLDYLHFQIEELEQLDCTAEGLQALESEQARLAHAERLLNETGTLLAELGENDPSVLQSLHQATRTLVDLSTLDPQLGEAQEMLESAGIQIGEVISSLSHYRDQVDLDPDRLRQVDEQLGRLHDAARKHRVSPGELATLLAGLQAEAASLGDADQRLGQLAQVEVQCNKAYTAAALALSDARSKAAARLSDTVTESMQRLGMQDGRFEVHCNADPAHTSASGFDRVTFMVSANPGQPLAALADVASGGELARISLAIQVATVDCGQVPTLIFDEVDVGIGGAVAEIVGNLLRRLATRRQILCVTHLPQVASQAHQQLRVHKASDGKTTETNIDPLDEAARVDEIARMLGGVDITRQTRQHALEMIQRAQNPSS
jgi:DNA repair protein RecN (Recombination protein N)